MDEVENDQPTQEEFDRFVPTTEELSAFNDRDEMSKKLNRLITYAITTNDDIYEGFLTLQRSPKPRE